MWRQAVQLSPGFSTQLCTAVCWHTQLSNKALMVRKWEKYWSLKGSKKRRQLDCFRVTSQDCHDLDDWAAPKTRNIKLNYFLYFLVWQHSQHIDKLNSAACKANFLRVLSLLWSDNKNCKLLHRSVVSKTKMDIDLKKIMYSLGNIYFNFVYIHFVFFFPLKTLVL